MSEVVKPSVAVGASLYLQRFTVAYEYPVHFTERLFSPDNSILRDTVTRLEPTRRHRCIAFVDDGLCAVRPTLISEIEAYADAHAAAIELVMAPAKVPRGEETRNVLFHSTATSQVLLSAPPRTFARASTRV